MCGRVYNTLNPNQILRLAGTNLMRNSNRHNVSYNAGPTNYIPAVRHHGSAENNHREVDMLQWGYKAPFGQFIINARVEEAAEKRTFKPLINTSRCVMIVEGYFEWTPNREPYVFKGMQKKEDDLPTYMLIAGLIAPDDTLILLTREAMKGFRHVHERMPVILDESEIDMWLDCENYKFEKILFSQILDEKKEKWSKVFSYQTGPLINNIKNKSEKVIQTLEEYKKDLDKNGIKKFFQPTKKVEKPVEAPKLEETKTPEFSQPVKFVDEVKTGEYNELQGTLASTQATESGFNEEKGFEEKVKVKSDAEVAREMAQIQQTIDEAGLGKDFAGFKVASAFIMGGKGDKGSKKRKEPTKSEELSRDNLKQVKLN